MATQYLKFTGKGEWFKIFAPDDYRGTKRWTLNFYPDDRKALDEAGIQLRYDRKTNSFIRPRRDVSKRIKNEIVEFDPPRVVNADGDRWDSETMGYIGNGTEIELTLAVYDTNGFGKGHRLEQVKVLKLVPYVKKETEPQKTEREAEPTVKTKKKMPF